MLWWLGRVLAVGARSWMDGGGGGGPWWRGGVGWIQRLVLDENERTGGWCVSWSLWLRSAADETLSAEACWTTRQSVLLWAKRIHQHDADEKINSREQSRQKQTRPKTEENATENRE